MLTKIVDHPLAGVLLSRLRDATTGRAEFAAAVDGLGAMLVYEATRSLQTEGIRVRTPLADTAGARLASEPLLVPVLRAGLGLLGPAQAPSGRAVALLSAVRPAPPAGGHRCGR